MRLLVQSLTFFVGGTFDHLVYTLYTREASIYGLCVTSIPGVENCSIQFTTDYSYQNLSPPVFGRINIPFKVIPEGISTIIYHQATIIADSSLTVIVRSRDVFTFPVIVNTSLATPTSVSTVSLLPTSIPVQTTNTPLTAILGAVIGALLLVITLGAAILLLIYKSK